MFDRIEETIGCLKEMREVCAACFRVIYSGGLTGEIGKELDRLKIKNGFGKRCQDLIAELEAK